MTDEPVKTVCCPKCREWYDARAGACYLCGEERPDTNIALIRAQHATALNTATSRQMALAQAEARVTSMIPSDARGKTGPSRLYPLPGAQNLAASIKSQVFGD